MQQSFRSGNRRLAHGTYQRGYGAVAMNCQHQEVTRMRSLPNGRVEWMCLCGRKPSCLPEVTQEQVQSFMLMHDSLSASTATNQDNAVSHGAKVE